MSEPEPRQRPPATRVGDLRGVDREIWRLAAVTFLTLVTEPLFLLADSAIVGHLGTPQLAGLSLAAALIGTVVSLCIFLAYGTTASVARLVGAGELRRALTQGMDGIWLAVAVGAVVSVVGVPATPWLVSLFGTGPTVASYAADYLHITLLGAIPMLVVLAATGVLRGVKDVRPPLVVAVGANLSNVALNYLLVYPLGMGIRGSALGSLIAQTGAAAALVAVVVRTALRTPARLAPDLAGVRRAAVVGVPLLVRTLLLRAALVLMTFGSAALGEPELAAMQLALSIWTFLAFTLDALGVSAQTMVGQQLGLGDAARARALTNRLVRWGMVLGVATGLVLVACSTVLAGLFTPDDRVRTLLTPVLLVAAVAQPLAGVVFTLDGILIGAGDGRYLAGAHAVVLVGFAPFAWWAIAGPGTLTWLWIAFAVGFMGSRGVVLVARSRGDTWMRLGA